MDYVFPLFNQQKKSGIVKSDIAGVEKCRIGGRGKKMKLTIEQILLMDSTSFIQIRLYPNYQSKATNRIDFYFDEIKKYKTTLKRTKPASSENKNLL